jgi:hypothetical protein
MRGKSRVLGIDEVGLILEKRCICGMGLVSGIRGHGWTMRASPLWSVTIVYLEEDEKLDFGGVFEVPRQCHLYWRDALLQSWEKAIRKVSKRRIETEFWVKGAMTGQTSWPFLLQSRSGCLTDSNQAVLIQTAEITVR